LQRQKWRHAAIFLCRSGGLETPQKTRNSLQNNGLRSTSQDRATTEKSRGNNAQLIAGEYVANKTQRRFIGEIALF
jgi:hypothetical protein